MNATLHKLNLNEWNDRYAQLKHLGLCEPQYGGPLWRHVDTGKNHRLKQLRFDPSPAALRLWNFLLTENQRLREARANGSKIVGTMKDLGTVPVMAYALPGMRAFYPDGAWWTPCLMECSDKLLQQAESMGIDASFCPVRAMLPAFQNGEHFPIPDLLLCSIGAVCDDFSAIAQRLEKLGHSIVWWEIPRRRRSTLGEDTFAIPGNLTVPRNQVDHVLAELKRVGKTLGDLVGRTFDDSLLNDGIRVANRVRQLLALLRQTVYSASAAPLPALEMLVAEMLAIHFCSDREESLTVLGELLAEAQRRLHQGQSVISSDAVRVFWVNPTADLRAMNLLEDCGGRLCGTDFMFTHALDFIPEDLPPWEALARTALADPMIGPAEDRAVRIVRDCRRGRAEAVVVSRIPGASHCAREGEVIQAIVRQELRIPTIELEIPPVSDAMLPTLGSRLQALMETARARRAI